MKMGKSRVETNEIIQNTYDDDALSRTQVYEWYGRFEHGSDVSDKPRAGRPNTATLKADTIKNLLDTDRPITIREIAIKMDLSVGSVYNIVTEE